METLSSKRKDAEVGPKCLRSLVMRKKRDSLERAFEAKDRGKGKKKGERHEREGRVIMVG